MSDMHPRYSVLAVELARDDGELFTTYPRFEEKQQAHARSVLYAAENGQSSMTGVMTHSLSTWEDYHAWSLQLQAAVANLQLVVVSPFARSVVQRLAGIARLLGLEQTHGAVLLFDRVRDPVQEINEPAIMSLQDRESWTIGRLDALGRCMHVRPSVSFDKPRDLIYLSMLGIGRST